MAHTRHNDETWAAIREAYLEGHTQERLAERYGVGRTTLGERARREGWRRSDQPAAPIPSLDADPEIGDQPMRPVVAVVADAYRKADIALRRGRPVEAQRCLAVARGFERLLVRDDWVSAALNDHWSAEADTLVPAAGPPWPEGVADADEARAELVREREAFESLLDDDPLDPVELVEGLHRTFRLIACLDIAARAAERRSAPADPANPPNPSNENHPAAWADSAGLPIPPPSCYERRE